MAAFELYASLLSSNAGRINDTVAELEACGHVDGLHIDVMDGRFVPNLAFGPQVVEAIRSHTRLPIEVHLMVEQPGHLFRAFAQAGAQRLIVHAEACPQLHRDIADIDALGLERGVALNPASSPGMLDFVLDKLDEVLLMGVDPGFGGQALITSVYEKVRAVRSAIDERGARASIIVDGGVKRENAAALAKAGSHRLVVGSALFAGPSISACALSFTDLSAVGVG